MKVGLTDSVRPGLDRQRDVLRVNSTPHGSRSIHEADVEALAALR